MRSVESESTDVTPVHLVGRRVEVLDAKSRQSRQHGVDLGLLGVEGIDCLAVVLVAIVAAISILNPVFFSLTTMFSIMRGSIVPLIFALGVLIVIISGGIDVSFAAIAIFSAYTTVKIAQDGNFDPGLIGVTLIAAAFGALLGFFNGAVIAKFKLPTLIVTLGTQSLFRGILLAYVGSKYIANPPLSLDEVAKTNIISIVNEQERGAFLHVLVVPVIILAILVAWMLKRISAVG